METIAQSADSAPPVSPQACKRQTPDLNPGNRVCFSRSASLEDLWPQIPAAPPGPCRAPCASRLSLHRLLWGTQHCAARLTSPAPHRVQLGRTAGLHPPGTPLLSLPPPLSRPGHLVCLMAEVTRLLQNIPAPRSLFHAPDPVTTDTTTPPRLQLKTARPACQARLHHAPSLAVWATNRSTPRSPDSPCRLVSTSSQLRPACPTSRNPPGHATWRALHLLALASSTWVLPLAQ